MPLANHPPTILIVEDDLDVAEMLNAYFRVQGYDVLTVNWGEDGLRACETTIPDLIILDIRLPDLDGFEVAKRLRAERRTKEVPIIFLTEKKEREDRLHGLEIGGDDYITKPFDVQELRLRVRNALTRVSQTVLRNPITGLPDANLVDERLREVLQEDDWALLLVSMENIEFFREEYGFIAADDVLRATSLMVHNTVQDTGTSADFLGHLTTDQLLVVTMPEVVSLMHQRVLSRLGQSLDYFYPVRDREEGSAETGVGAKRLSVWAAMLRKQDGDFSNIDQLKTRLLQARPRQ